MLNQVKGYINEMAIRLEDEEERISNLARLFFHELSKKGSVYRFSYIKYNFSDACIFLILRHSVFRVIILFSLSTGNNPVYNLLPDILGKLSNQNLERESFCNIMQFLIGSIKKVRFN